jgi:uncharacterized protein (TIGR02466 family)
MAKVEHWFPTVIYTQEKLFSSAENENWKNICIEISKDTQSGGKNWLGGTYTSLDTCNIEQDYRFSSLLDSVSFHVHEFAKLHNSTGVYECKTAWFNINTTGTFQEYHHHSNSIFSAIYYVTSPEGSGSVVFEDPREPEMMPVKDVNPLNPLTYVTARYKPVAGNLIIFRSHLRHLVEPGTNTDPRISIALNFS